MRRIFANVQCYEQFAVAFDLGTMNGYPLLYDLYLYMEQLYYMHHIFKTKILFQHFFFFREFVF